MPDGWFQSVACEDKWLKMSCCCGKEVEHGMEGVHMP